MVPLLTNNNSPTFLTVDPLDGTPTIATPYHYADNDPLNKTDALGLYPNDAERFSLPICEDGQVEFPTTPSASTHIAIQACHKLSPPACSNVGSYRLGTELDRATTGVEASTQRYARLREWHRFEAHSDRVLYGVFEPAKIRPGDTQGHLQMMETHLAKRQAEASAIQSATAWRSVASTAKRVGWAAIGVDVLMIAGGSYHHYRCTGDVVGSMEMVAMGGGKVGSGLAGAAAGARAGTQVCKFGSGIGVAVCVGAFAVIGAVFGENVYRHSVGQNGLLPAPGKPCFLGDTSRLC